MTRKPKYSVKGNGSGIQKPAARAAKYNPNQNDLEGHRSLIESNYLPTTTTTSASSEVSNKTNRSHGKTESSRFQQGIANVRISLLEENMKVMYENCEWGWKSKEKMKELTSKKARFLIVYTSNVETERPIGFVHFRFDIDYGRRVVYCYEVQIEASGRGHKLGSWMMKLLELFAANDKRSRVVLTVLKENVAAIAFFKKIGYGIDETSPGKLEGRPYFIYSKAISPAPESGIS